MAVGSQHRLAMPALKMLNVLRITGMVNNATQLPTILSRKRWLQALPVVDTGFSTLQRF